MPSSRTARSPSPSRTRSGSNSSTPWRQPRGMAPGSRPSRSVAHHQYRAAGVVDAPVADRSEREAAMPSGAHHEQAGVLGHVDQHPGGLALHQLTPDLGGALTEVF